MNILGTFDLDMSLSTHRQRTILAEGDMAEKLIIPNEAKVCATCSYWDGERTIDPDVQVVVVKQDAEGECLAHAQQTPGLWDTRQDPACLWEPLAPDEPPVVK